MVKTRSRAKELNAKFHRRFGPQSAFQEHPGTEQIGLNTFVLVFLFILFLMVIVGQKVVDADALEDQNNFEGHLFHVLRIGVPGVIYTVVIPWLYLLKDVRLNEGLKKWFRSIRNN